MAANNVITTGSGLQVINRDPVTAALPVRSRAHAPSTRTLALRPGSFEDVGGSAERPSNVAMNAAVHLDGFVVNYHDDESAFEYVTKHCGREAGQAYRCLLAPAFRADLFRFCALSADGGVYLDTDLVLLKPIASVVDMCDAGATIGRDISTSNGSR